VFPVRSGETHSSYLQFVDFTSENWQVWGEPKLTAIYIFPNLGRRGGKHLTSDFVWFYCSSVCPYLSRWLYNFLPFNEMCIKCALFVKLNAR
jgi:hypothetical protein